MCGPVAPVCSELRPATSDDAFVVLHCRGAHSALMRKILHIDMDAFFAAVEQRDRPEYRGKPIAVGGRSRRGVVAAASYEARAYGVHSAMPSVVAERRCPGLIFVKPRFEVYKSISREIRDIFEQYTELVEPLSIDEAYLDVTEPLKGPPSATLLARTIRQEIRETTGLTASAGISFNKFLAKTASGINKPDAQTVITPEDAPAFLSALPIEQFYGVGEVTARKMKAKGIHCGADLLEREEADLVRLFGKAGRFYYRMARGEDDRQVSPDRIRKSVGAERTFMEDIADPEEMRLRIREVASYVAERLARTGARGRTITLKIKYLDFEISSRSRTLHHPISTAEEIGNIATRLLETPAFPERPVRLLGVSLSGLVEPDAPGFQLPIPFTDERTDW